MKGLTEAESGDRDWNQQYRTGAMIFVNSILSIKVVNAGVD